MPADPSFGDERMPEITEFSAQAEGFGALSLQIVPQGAPDDSAKEGNKRSSSAQRDGQLSPHTMFAHGFFLVCLDAQITGRPRRAEQDEALAGVLIIKPE